MNHRIMLRPSRHWRARFLLLALILISSGIFAQTLLPGQWAATTFTSTTKVRAMVVNGSTVLAGADTGVWSSTDNGTTWTAVNNGLTAVDVRALAVSGTTLYAGTNGGGIFRSTDGTNWSAFNTGLGNLTVYALAVSGSDVFAGTFGGGIYRLNGTTWTAVNNGISASARIYTLFANGNDLFAGGELVINGNRHIYRSSDRGATWTATGSASNFSNAVTPPERVFAMAARGTNLFAATFNGLYRSTNNGTDWQLLPGLPLNALSLAFNADGSALFASGTTLADGSLYGVSVSTDNGNTWRAMTYGLPGANVLAVSGTTLFAGGGLNGGIYTTSLSNLVTAASVSAANFQAVNAHAPESLGSIFGNNLANGQFVATTLPIPTSLGGTTVSVLDSRGVARLAPLFFVNQTQINYQIPAGTAPGWAHLTITNANGVISYATANVKPAAFSLFTADANGSGAPAAYIQRVRANGSQQFEPVAQYDGAQQKWVPVPIDLGAATDRVYLVLFGTGFRGWDAVSFPVVGYFNAGGVFYPSVAEYSGAQGTFVGVDQVNLLVPQALAGKGDITLYVTAATGGFTNTVTLNVR